MNPLRFVYNIASNKPPGYRHYPDDADSAEVSRSTTPDIRSSSRAPLLGDQIEDESTEDTKPRPSTRFRRAQAVAGDWITGPKPPRIWKIKPVFPIIQEAPIKLLDIIAPRRWHRVVLLLFVYFFYILAFVLVLRKSAFTADVPGYGSPARLSCIASFWYAEEYNE